jgi:uncharacterized cupredoxin-like copper-binding protein
MRPPSRAAVFGAALFASLLVAGGAWAAHRTGRSSAGGGGPTIEVTERDFHIAVQQQVRAGTVQLLVRNVGPDMHELIVARAGQAALPLRADGLTVDENALAKVTAGSLEPAEPGSVRRLRLHLGPGRYVLFCNMSGHYLGGMHTELDVR